MKALYDFKCINNHIIERFIDSEIHMVECPFCQQPSERVISPPAYLKVDGFRSDIMSTQWAKNREKNFVRTKERDG